MSLVIILLLLQSKVKLAFKVLLKKLTSWQGLQTCLDFSS